MKNTLFLIAGLLVVNSTFAQTSPGYSAYLNYMSKNNPDNAVDTFAIFNQGETVPGTLESTFANLDVPVTPEPTPTPSPTPVPICSSRCRYCHHGPTPTPTPKVNIVVESTAHIVNLSTLCYISNQYGWGTSGGVIENKGDNNNSTFTLLIRASGPSLGDFGVTDYIVHPVLTVFHNGQVIATNTGWTNNANMTAAQFNKAFIDAGAFDYAANSTDSAIVLTVTVPNNTAYSFTAQVQGLNGEVGKCLIEVYEVSN